MTEEARKIQDSIYRYKGVKASNQSADDFIQTIYNDIQNMLLTKYPYLDINFLFPKEKEVEEKQKAMLEERRVKGYAFDSLVYRYKAAREEQMRYEQKEALKDLPNPKRYHRKKSKTLCRRALCFLVKGSNL